jgi:hypothetical protein
MYMGTLWSKVKSQGVCNTYDHRACIGDATPYPSYARGQPEPGKRDQTLQKTQNNRPVHQEREARPSTILHTLPHEGEDAPNPGGKGASRAEGGWQRGPWTWRSNRWRNEAIYCHWAEGSPKPKKPRARGKGGVTTLQALGETPAERGTLCLPVEVPYAYQVGYGPLPYFGERRRPKVWGGGGQFATCEDDREPQNQGRRD